MPTVHFICGPTGAGKTTYAAAIATRTKAVRFSIDEWMTHLFVMDRPEPPTIEWALERTARCEDQMWAVAEQLIDRGIDVVFDLGLSTHDHRDRFRARAMQTVATPKMHYLDVDRATRHERIKKRNAQLAVMRPPESYIVSDAMFDWMETWFEAPTDDELYGAMIVCED